MINSSIRKPNLLVATLFVLMFITCLNSIGHCQKGNPMSFMKQDRNNDGFLSSGEFRGPINLFEKIDSNQNKRISREEFELFFKSRNDNTSSVSKVKSPVQNNLKYFDAHAHLAGWMGKPKNNKDNYLDAAKIALKTMEREGIKTMLIMPTPQTIGTDHGNNISDYQSVLKMYPDRFKLLAGGGTLNVMIQEAVKANSVSHELMLKFEQKARELLQAGAIGFGEMTASHLSMNKTHPYITAPPDHPLFLLLSDIAAKNNVPIDFHMEAVVKDMPLTGNAGKMPDNPDIIENNIDAFERLLGHNPKARIIWSHAGWDNTGQRTVELTERLLSKYPNLFMSIRIVAKNIPGRPIDGAGNIRPEWLQLMKKFPDRFILGSDEFFMPESEKKTHPSARSAAETISFLSHLPREIADKIGYDNAERLFNLKN